MTTHVKSIADLTRSSAHTSGIRTTERDQEEVNLFADATGDISGSTLNPSAPRPVPSATHRARLPHVVAHPRAPRWRDEGRRRRHGVNYGTNKVRFTSPVPSFRDSSGATLAAVDEVAGGSRSPWT